MTAAAQNAAPAFDVASIHRAAPGLTGGRVQFPPGGRFTAENVPLDFILQQVYGVRDFQIAVDPKWKAIAADTRYQVSARAADPAASGDQIREMVKRLLRERFDLKLRTERREFPVYLLIQSSRGVKGARSADGPPGGIASMAPGWIRGKGVTTDFLALALTRYVDRPVVDRTALDRVLDFDLTWTPADLTGAAAAASGPECSQTSREMAKRLKGVNVDGFTCPSIYTAVEEQLGLKLEAQRAPLDVLVIDSVQAPTEN
jgi:uncharacterized protein (TIGR03435 family)